MFSSGIIYNGKVTVTIKNKPPSNRHNAGTAHLFNLIYRIFTQRLVLKDMVSLSHELPSYIVLIHNGSNTVSETSILTSPDYVNYNQYSLLLQEIPITSKEITTDGIKYSCLLTNSLINKSVVYTDFNGYVLMLDGNRKNVLAVAKLDLKEIQPIYDDSLGQATIDWDMSFDNATEEE